MMEANIRMNSIVKKAINYAFDKHKNQSRKISGVPYITHPMAVAGIIAEVTRDEEIISAAILHDIIEDCGVSHEELKKEFGERIANIVLQLTKPQNKSMIKSREALMIKCADVLHNISDGEEWYIKKKLKDIWS